MSEDFPIVAIVDDDVAARRGLARLVASLHFRVKQFATAEQYLEATAAVDAFCVVIDIHLGEGMSGLDLGRTIADSIPIIFLTGAANETLRARAMEIGCVAFLEKPCRAEHLIAAIKVARNRP